MQETPIELNEGALAPDFAMRDMQGNISRLSDLKDKKDIVVYFYQRISRLVALHKQLSLTRTMKNSKKLALR
jgi:peroxiredoxin